MHYTDLTCSCTLNNYSALFPDVSKLSFDQVYTWYNKDNVKQGWVIYVSVHHDILNDTITDFVRFLLNTGEPFAVPRDYNVAVSITSGELGFDRIGKLIMVYPSSDASANKIAKELVQRAAGKLYLKVLNTFHVGEGVYADYMNSADTPLGVFDIIANKKRLKAILKTRKWPFSADKKFAFLKKLLKGRYLITAYLKSDQKCFVAEGLNIWPFWQMQDVVIKYGFCGASLDILGRDMRSRIYSQVEIHKILISVPEVPRILDVFSVDEDVALVMERFDGVTLHEFAAANVLPTPWYNKTNTDKQTLLDLMIQVIDLIKRVHALHVVHRDLSANNFIVKDAKLVGLIDWELGSVISPKQPKPYEYGTLGFMSKEQLGSNDATYGDDIAGIGGLFAYLLTGIAPTRFSFNNVARINEQLIYFIHDEVIAETIAYCFDEPENRPSLQKLKEVFVERKVDNNVQPSSPAMKKISWKENFEKILLPGIGAITNIRIHFNPFLKKVDGSDEKYLQALTPGFGNGLAGMLYMVSRLPKGKDVISLEHRLFEVLHHKFTKNHAADKLFVTGQVGIAFSLVHFLKSGDQEYLNEIRNVVKNISVQFSESYGINNGIAGEALVYLQVPEKIMDDQTRMKLITILSKLITTPGLFVESPDVTYLYPGFLNGGSGIIYVLLEAQMQGHIDIQTELLTNAITKLVEWKDRFNNPYEGFVFEENLKFLDSKISLVRLLLKGYEVLKDDRLKNLSETMLATINSEQVTTNLSFASGSSHLGFVFLEAAKVLSNPSYILKAENILRMAWYSSIASDDEATVFWLNDLEHEPNPGYLYGYIGVVDFVNAYINAEIPFPIFE